MGAKATEQCCLQPLRQRGRNGSSIIRQKDTSLCARRVTDAEVQVDNRAMFGSSESAFIPGERVFHRLGSHRADRTDECHSKILPAARARDLQRKTTIFSKHRSKTKPQDELRDSSLLLACETVRTPANTSKTTRIVTRQ